MLHACGVAQAEVTTPAALVIFCQSPTLTSASHPYPCPTCKHFVCSSTVSPTTTVYGRTTSSFGQARESGVPSPTQISSSTTGSRPKSLNGTTGKCWRPILTLLSPAASRPVESVNLRQIGGIVLMRFGQNALDVINGVNRNCGRFSRLFPRLRNLSAQLTELSQTEKHDYSARVTPISRRTKCL